MSTSDESGTIRLRPQRSDSHIRERRRQRETDATPRHSKNQEKSSFPEAVPTFDRSSGLRFLAVISGLAVIFQQAVLIRLLVARLLRYSPLSFSVREVVASSARPRGYAVPTGFFTLRRFSALSPRLLYAIVVSSNASKISFRARPANDGCFAHIQLSRKLASMSAIGASDWICHSFLS